jgi:hypothetical protein
MSPNVILSPESREAKRSKLLVMSLPGELWAFWASKIRASLRRRCRLGGLGACLDAALQVPSGAGVGGKGGEQVGFWGSTGGADLVPGAELGEFADDCHSGWQCLGLGRGSLVAAGVGGQGQARGRDLSFTQLLGDEHSGIAAT